MKEISLVMFFVCVYISAQTKKRFIPRSGDIEFKKVAKITDRKLFDETFTSYKKIFIEGTKIADKEKSGTITDPEKVKQQERFYTNLYTSNFIEKTMLFIQDSTRIRYKFQDSLLWSYENKLVNNKLLRINLINTKNKKISNISVNDSTSVIGNETYDYSPIKIISFIEKKNERKKIAGYNCFKIIYEFKIAGEKEDYFTANTIYKNEEWVTEKINSDYNPVMNDKGIIEKYYPLEITETINDVRGFEVKYTLERFTLK